MSHRLSPRKGFAGCAKALACCALVLAGASRATAQVGPEESAKMLKPAEGLEATLWASEPMVVNPTNMDIDSRGRVWITEGLNYRLTHGGASQFPRVEDADKIKILEDTDGDGKADKVTVFADKICPDPDGPGRRGEVRARTASTSAARSTSATAPTCSSSKTPTATTRPTSVTPLLTGFGGVDSDHGVHGMVLGLDGKLYFTHGDGCCSFQQDHSHSDQNFDVVDKSGRHVCVRPARQHPAGQPRRHPVRDPRRPPAEQLRDLPELASATSSPPTTTTTATAAAA